jgi:hypothetical protein
LHRLSREAKTNFKSLPVMNAIRSKIKSSPLSSAIFLLSLMWCVYWFVHSFKYWEDDSYIHLEYARSFFEGRGFMFNGKVSNGDTSPLWVMLLAATHWVTPDWLVGGKSLTVLGVVFLFGVAHTFNKRIAGELGFMSALPAALMTAVCVLNPYFCTWAYSGMEAIAAAGLLMAVAMLVVPARPTALSFFAAAACMGLGPVLRPEMMLLVVAGGPFLAWQWWLLTKNMSAIKRTVYFSVAGMLLAAPMLVWIGYALHEFGYVFPNTNAAKQAAPGSSVLFRLLQVYGLGFPGVLIAGAWLAIQQAYTLSQGKSRSNVASRPIFPAFTWPILIYFLMTSAFYVINHTYVQTRYIAVVATPLVGILGLALMRSIGLRFFYVFASLSALLAILASILLAHPFIRNKSLGDEISSQLGNYISSHVPKDAPVAVYAIGHIGFIISNPIIDTGGITDPSASKFLYSPLADRVKWAKTKGARYYINGEKPEDEAELILEIVSPTIGWSIDPDFYNQVKPIRLWKLRQE